jgi:hypothetical protein
LLLKFRQWIKKHQEWHQAHQLAWAPAIVETSDGLTPFIHAAQAQLLSVIDGLHFEIAGKSEKYLSGTIQGTGLRVYLHSEGAQIHEGDKELFWSEYYDYKTPQDLIETIVSALTTKRFSE